METAKQLDRQSDNLTTKQTNKRTNIHTPVNNPIYRHVNNTTGIADKQKINKRTDAKIDKQLNEFVNWLMQ